MAEVQITTEAQQDIDAIYDYITDDRQSLDEADRWLDELIQLFRLMATQPRMGRLYEPLHKTLPNTRMFPSGAYVIFYVPISDGINVLHVAHTARDRSAVFREWFSDA